MNTQKKSIVLVLALLFAMFLGTSLARPILMGNTGVTLDPPLEVLVETSEVDRQSIASFKINGELSVAATKEQRSLAPNLSTNNAAFYQSMIRQLSSSLPGFKLIKSGKTTINRLDFFEIQATTSIKNSDQKVYIYILHTFKDRKSISVSFGTPVIFLKNHRTAIAKMAGSIKIN
jgi:hypothetical protein